MKLCRKIDKNNFKKYRGTRRRLKIKIKKKRGFKAKIATIHFAFLKIRNSESARRH